MDINFDCFLTHIRLYADGELVEDLGIDCDEVATNLRPSNLPIAKMYGYTKSDIIDNIVEACLYCFEEDLAYDGSGKMICIYGEDFEDDYEEVDLSILRAPLKKAVKEFAKLTEEEMNKKEQES